MTKLLLSTMLALTFSMVHSAQSEVSPEAHVSAYGSMLGIDDHLSDFEVSDWSDEGGAQQLQVYHVLQEPARCAISEDHSLIQKKASLSKKESSTDWSMAVDEDSFMKKRQVATGPFKFARRDTCNHKKGDVKIKIRKGECEELGGQVSAVELTKPADSWLDCTLDFCEDGTYGVGQCSNSSGTGIMTLPAAHCRAMGGTGYEVYQDHQWCHCQLNICEGDGYSAMKVGSCQVRKGYGVIQASGSTCRAIGGNMNGVPGDNQWTGCHLDWCTPPATPAPTRFYYLGNPNQLACQPEKSVQNAEQCQAAAAALGMGWTEWHGGGIQHGCVKDDENDVFWSTHDSGARSWISPVCADTITVVTFFLGTIGTAACQPSDVPVQNAEQCQAAAAALGMGWTEWHGGGSLGYPYGCVKENTNRLLWNTQKGEAVSWLSPVCFARD